MKTLLVSLSPCLLLSLSCFAVTPPGPGATAEDWARYHNAVAAENQRELAAKQEAARLAAAKAQADYASALAAARALQNPSFDAKMARLQQQREQAAYTRWLEMQTLLMQQRLQK